MIRTVEEYLESLRDGRVIYNSGERVKDVTTHPILRRVVQGGCMDYALTNDPEHRDLFVTKNEKGEDVHFLWTAPKTSEDLIRKRNVYIEGSRFGGVGLHSMGVDALAASRVVAGRMDSKLGTNYTEHVELYREHLQSTDAGVTGAQTDVKGDRSVHPASQVQHKDYYVRIVDRQKDGIIVSGAKYHISSTPACNEVIVLPCRTHLEPDKDYALVFWTPLNAEGITLISSEPTIRGASTEETFWNYPVSSRHGIGDSECMIIFENVFVPWENVFQAGEYQFSRDIAYAFGTFHRLYATCRMVPAMENMTGIAALMAEYNGLEKYTHIQNKLAYLAYVTENLKTVSEAACMFPDKEAEADLVVPNGMMTNIAKYIYADSFHEVTKVVEDICGGIAADPIQYRDWMNPEERPFLEKYLGGKAGIPTEHRLKAIRYLKDVTGWQHGSHTIHAEGSLAAQLKMFYFDADWDMYKAQAKRGAGIPGWEEHPIIGSLRDLNAMIDPKMPPVDTSYNL